MLASLWCTFPYAFSNEVFSRFFCFLGGGVKRRRKISRHVQEAEADHTKQCWVSSGFKSAIGNSCRKFWVIISHTTNYNVFLCRLPNLSGENPACAYFRLIKDGSRAQKDRCVSVVHAAD